MYTNAAPITIPAQGNASPYGTNSIEVAGVPGLVSRVGVELVGIQHSFAADIRMLLVGPAGTAWILNRQGGLDDIPAGGDLRIDTDSTGKTFSESVGTGVRAIEPERDPAQLPGTPMPAPAPQTTYGASMRPLLGGSPNGTWRLYITDEVATAAGSVPGGWRLHLDTTVTDRLKGADLGETTAAAVERGTASVQLYRQETRAPLGALDLRVRTVDGTAKAGEDYVAVDEVVHFPSGSTVAELEVPTINNDVAEGAETFNVEYVDLPGGPTGVEGPTDPLQPITIVDDDGAAGLFVRFKAVPLRMRENGQRDTLIPVTRTGPVSDPMAITFDTLGGTANTADLDAATTSTQIQANSRFTTLLIPGAANDGADEVPIETTNLVVRANGSSVAFGALQILDGQGPGLLYVTATSTPADETKPAEGAVFAAREGGTFTTTESPSVTITDGTAKTPADYTPVGGNVRSASMNANTVGRRVDLNPGTAADVADEGTEEIRVTMTAPGGGSSVDPARAAVNVSVLDSSPPPGYGGEIAADDNAAPSTEGTVIRIPVSRVGPPNTAVSAKWSTFDVSAVAGRDYEAASGTVSWAPFETAAKEIQVTTFQDKLVERDPITGSAEERVGVALDTPTISDPSKTIGLSPARVEGRIADDDTTGPGQLDFDAGALSVTEGEPIVIPIHRTLGQTGPVDVTCRVTDGVGNATAGADLDATGTATFATNIRESTCTLNTTSDALDEADETLRIELVNPTGDAVIGPQSARDLTITDDDPPGSGPIRLGASEVTVAESAGAVPITIDRGPDTVGDVTALVTLEPGTAGAADATLATQRVSIPAGQASATLDLGIVDDSDDETDTEDLRVVLSDPQGGIALGEPSAERIVITDDDGGGVASMADGGRTFEVLEKAGSADLIVTRRSGFAPGAGFSWSFVAGTAGNKDVSTRSGSVRIRGRPDRSDSQVADRQRPPAREEREVPRDPLRPPRPSDAGRAHEP